VTILFQPSHHGIVPGSLWFGTELIDAPQLHLDAIVKFLR
jgi:hypothetical protein